MTTALRTYPLEADQAALWFLGQAGYLLRAGTTVIAIDPYLSDSVARTAPDYARQMPVPLPPAELDVDVFIVTHDHLDHLDPETIGPYPHKARTVFVAPRLACRKLETLGVPPANLRRVDIGDSLQVHGATITGVFALPTDATVADTTGYRVRFANGRTVYHSSDTGFSEHLLAAAPQAEVLLVCINGKWGNLTVPQAAALAARVRPRYAIPNHYDLMRLNSATPHDFVDALKAEAPSIQTRVLGIMEPFLWS